MKDRPTEKQDFDRLVDLAMANPGLSTMRQVVEKELLHYEIFQALNGEGLLKDLVFQGGTSLRLCRGSPRYSEDLNFAGGVDFSSHQMDRIQACVEQHIGARFGLKVSVRSKPAPLSDAASHQVKVDKWWISIETAPENPAMPRQKIKLEIANVPAHTRELRPLIANYESVRAMAPVLVNTESLSEIMADKVVAFPTSMRDQQGRPVGPDALKIRHRDIWDLAWLSQQGATLQPELVVAKLGDYGLTGYEAMLDESIRGLSDVVHHKAFQAQMSRFIDSATRARTLDQAGYLDYLAASVGSLLSTMRNHLAGDR